MYICSYEYLLSYSAQRRKVLIWKFPVTLRRIDIWLVTWTRWNVWYSYWNITYHKKKQEHIPKTSRRVHGCLQFNPRNPMMYGEVHLMTIVIIIIDICVMGSILHVFPWKHARYLIKQTADALLHSAAAGTAVRSQNRATPGRPLPSCWPHSNAVRALILRAPLRYF